MARPAPHEPDHVAVSQNKQAVENIVCKPVRERGGYELGELEKMNYDGGYVVSVGATAGVIGLAGSFQSFLHSGSFSAGRRM